MQDSAALTRESHQAPTWSSLVQRRDELVDRLGSIQPQSGDQQVPPKRSPRTWNRSVREPDTTLGTTVTPAADSDCSPCPNPPAGTVRVRFRSDQDRAKIPSAVTQASSGTVPTRLLRRFGGRRACRVELMSCHPARTSTSGSLGHSGPLAVCVRPPRCVTVCDPGHNPPRPLIGQHPVLTTPT